jgi:3-hydroxybutyryl-CoA dehydrogenase
MGEIKKVAVIGAGTMGSQIGLQTAISGRFDVTLADVSALQLERAMAQNLKLVSRGVEKGRLTQEAARAGMSRLRTTTALENAVADADLVIEAVFEDEAAKRAVFRKLGELAPQRAILASNSSTIVISRLAELTGRPEQCCNMHFFHPVTVMKLCEVGRGPRTSDETIEAAMEFVRRIDRIPVLVKKEVHGFLVNRVLIAATEETIRLLEGGYASAEDLDRAVKYGLNWPMGLFELMDFAGIDIMYGALVDRHRAGEGAEPPQVLKQKVEAGHLGRKTGKGFYEYPRPN